MCVCVCVGLSSPQDVEKKVRVARSLPCAAHGFLCFEELQERALQLAWRLRLAGSRRLLRALAMSLVEPLDKVSSAQAGKDQTWVGTSDHPVEEVQVTRLTSIIATSIWCSGGYFMSTNALTYCSCSHLDCRKIASCNACSTSESTNSCRFTCLAGRDT